MNRKLMCWILVFSLAFQPLIFEGIAWAQESGDSPAPGAATTPDTEPSSSPSVGESGAAGGTTAADQAKKAEEAQKQFDETYQKLMATEEIKNPSQSGGIGGFFKKAALWASGNKGKVDKAVNEANAELKKAKEEMTRMKAELAAGVAAAKGAALQNAQATMQKNLELSAKIQTAISVAMKKIGDFLTKLSGTLKIVASTLQKVALGVAAIPAVGTAISAVLFTVAKVLGGVSGVVGAVGKSMIAFSQKADLSAKDFLGMITDAKNGWKDGTKGLGRPETPRSGAGNNQAGSGTTAPRGNGGNPNGPIGSPGPGNSDGLGGGNPSTSESGRNGGPGAADLVLPGGGSSSREPVRSTPTAGEIKDKYGIDVKDGKEKDIDGFHATPGKPSPEALRQLDSVLGNLPESFRDATGKIVFNGSIKSNDGSASGLFSQQKKFIFGKEWTINLAEAGANDDGYTTVHEMTHAFHQKNPQVMTAWQSQFWNGDKPKVPSEIAYANSDPCEDMAVATGLYYTKSAWLKQNYPEKYEFIRNNIMGGRTY